MNTNETTKTPQVGGSALNDGLDTMTHFWCEICDKIQPTFFEGAHNNDVSETFVGGDIVCKQCHFIIATAYVYNAIITGRGDAL
ncbi:MAG: hypothetical protein PHT88_04920 [Candidatus Moranbacteria bacterium]|nr:hypothetical protein [Candidatus Moranbacteria bacterium]